MIKEKGSKQYKIRYIISIKSTKINLNKYYEWHNLTIFKYKLLKRLQTLEKLKALILKLPNWILVLSNFINENTKIRNKKTNQLNYRYYILNILNYNSLLNYL